MLTGTCAPWIREAADRSRYAFTLLCAPDLPWEHDPVRYRPAEQQAFFDRFEAELIRLGRSYAVVRGRGTERTQSAIRALEAAGLASVSTG